MHSLLTHPKVNKISGSQPSKIAYCCKLGLKSSSIRSKTLDSSPNLCVCICLCSDGGVIAGAIIAAVVVCILIAGLLYYLFSVKGYKVGGMRMQTRPASENAVSSELVTRSPAWMCSGFLPFSLLDCVLTFVFQPAFTNPNFAGESFSWRTGLRFCTFHSTWFVVLKK